MDTYEIILLALLFPSLSVTIFTIVMNFRSETYTSFFSSIVAGFVFAAIFVTILEILGY